MRTFEGVMSTAGVGTNNHIEEGGKDQKSGKWRWGETEMDGRGTLFLAAYLLTKLGYHTVLFQS